MVKRLLIVLGLCTGTYCLAETHDLDESAWVMPAGDDVDEVAPDIEEGIAQPPVSRPSAAMVIVRRVGIRALYAFFDTKAWLNRQVLIAQHTLL
jgi:hypothetical protein